MADILTLDQYFFLLLTEWAGSGTRFSLLQSLIFNTCGANKVGKERRKSEVHLILTASPHSCYYLARCTQENILTSDDDQVCGMSCWWRDIGPPQEKMKCCWDFVCSLYFLARFLLIILGFDWKSICSLYTRGPYI